MTERTEREERVLREADRLYRGNAWYMRPVVENALGRRVTVAEIHQWQDAADATRPN